MRPIRCFAALAALTAMSVPSVRGALSNDDRQRKRDEYEAAVAEVNRLVAAGRLREAETVVAGSEPKFANEWSMGAFGYRTRMQIGDAYREQQNLAQALRLYQAARPGGGCGNCMSAQYVFRNLAMAEVYESRLALPSAFAAYVGAVPATLLGGGFLRVALGAILTGGPAFAFPASSFVNRELWPPLRSGGSIVLFFVGLAAYCTGPLLLYWFVRTLGRGGGNLVWSYRCRNVAYH